MTIKKRDIFSNSLIKVPFFYPSIDQDDRKAVNQALKLALLTDGPRLKKFEDEFAKFTGAKYAVGVSNATSALHLSLKALGIGKGDEVIIPNMTFVATANSVLLSGAIPVLADIDEDCNISIESIQKNISAKTKAILPVHFAGKVTKINQIKKIACENDLFLIEDCAHAIGTRLSEKHVGIFGDMGCFSFYPTKNITTIEGGMIITNSKTNAEKIQILRNHGITRTLKHRYSHGKPWDYDVVEPGYNYRLDEIRSTLGINQLKRVQKLNKLREKASKYYNLKLKNIKGIQTPIEMKESQNSYHLYIIRINDKFKISRDSLFKKLLKQKISTSVHYKPLHKFTAYKNAKRGDKLENSEIMYKQILSLPLYPYITEKEQDIVIKCIRDASE